MKCRKMFFMLLMLAMFLSVSGNLLAQNTAVTVTGIVSDGKLREPLIGVSVVEKGTTNGTVTSLDGDFFLQVAPNAILVFSYIGYIPVEMPVAGKTKINVSMDEDSEQLEEVVVIGYGSTRKQDLSMAVTTVKVDESSMGRPASIGSLLQGRVTGLNVSQSGDPTQDSKMSIRGKGNREGDAILYIVDGVPGAPFSSSDIETITVLKDAASASIYGAHAGSGGVIVVTTKQAKEGKATVSANAWGGVQQAWRLPEVLSSEQFNQVWKDAAMAANKQVPTAYNPELFPYGNVTRTDWLEEVFRSGTMQHYDVTIRGGSKDLKALASISYDDVEGTIRTTYQKKMTSRLNVDFNLNPITTIRQRFTYDFSNGKGEGGAGHSGAIFGAMAYPRFSTVHEYAKNGDPLYGDDGRRLYGGTIPRWALEEGFSVEADLRNPVAMLEKIREHNPKHRVLSTTSLEIKPLKGLSFKSDFSYDVFSHRKESFEMKFLEPGRTIDENYRRIQNELKQYWIWESILNYSTLIKEVHYVSAMAGYTMNKTNRRYEWTRMRGFSSEYEHYTIFPNGTNWTSDKPNEEIWDEAGISGFGRLSYSFDDRYFATGNVRRDYSSKLHPDNNAETFWGFSGAWKVTSESFMPKTDWLSFLKFRLSWAQVGNVNSVKRFIYAPPYKVTGWPLFLGKDGNNQAFGIYQATIPNTKLKWETTEQTNIGMDVGLFKNKLNLTVDRFHKLTKDLIEEMPMPSAAGVESPPKSNVGEVKNTGWEITLNYTDKIGKVSFEVGGNFTALKNEVINIGPRDFIAHTDEVNSMRPLRSKVGEPWNSFYLIKTTGIFRSQEEVDNYTWTNPTTGETKKIQPNAKPGDLKFADVDQDGKINDADRVYMGAYDVPDFAYGFNLGASWNNFSVTLLFQGVKGAKIFNGIKQMTYTGSKGWNMSTDVLNSYNYNPNSKIPRLAVAEDPNGNYTTVSDFFLDKGDYLRLRNLNISYSIPQLTLQKIGLNGLSARVYFNGENLLTFTKYKGFDPEVGSDPEKGNMGIDQGRYPVSRVMSVGCSVSF